MRRLVVLLALAPALGLSNAAAQSPAAMDSIVERASRTFANQGAAAAVVKDGTVIVARGFGVKKLGAPDPVGPDTRFGIASNRKAFTATALGILVEEGKVAWDAPAIRYLPEFAMYDPYVTRALTIRDLLVHRSGLGLGDLLWWPASTYDREMRADALVTFQRNADGGIDQVKMRARDPETDFPFDFHDVLLKPKRAR